MSDFVAVSSQSPSGAHEGSHTNDTDIPLKKPKTVAISISNSDSESDTNEEQKVNVIPPKIAMTNVGQPSQLIVAKTEEDEDNDFELEYIQSADHGQAKSLFLFIKPKIVTMVQLSSRALALFDMATDINLLYKSQISNNKILTVCLFISIIAPYLLQYSCGIKLFTLNRTFERLKGLKKLLTVIFLLPFGVLFFVFLDLFDIFFNFYVVCQLLFCCSSLVDIQRTEEDVAAQLGMDRMNWEGIKRQKKVAQMMFETTPQIILQICLYFEIIPSLLEISGSITAQDILISTSAAFASMLLELVKLKIESKAVEESFLQYSLTCFMARIGWIPFRSSIRRFLEDPNARLAYISYNIRFMFVSVDFFFSELTIHELIETLLVRPIKKDGYDSIIIIDFHESLRLLTVSSLVELLRTCAERHIFIKGLNDMDKLNWNDAVLESMENDNDVRIISNSRDSQGTSHLATIYKSEEILQHVYGGNKIQRKLRELVNVKKSKDGDFTRIAFLPTIFSQCIGLDFDVNVSSLQTGETLVFELIKHSDYNNLWYLLNEYQTTRNCDVFLDIRNKEGKSPLFYALDAMNSKDRRSRKRKKSTKKKTILSPNTHQMTPGHGMHEVDGTMFNMVENMTQLNRAIQNSNYTDMQIADMTRNLSEPMTRNLSDPQSQTILAENDNKMYMLLLKSNADPNFPVLKKSGLTQSCLGYLLENEKLEIILEIIPFDAELNSKEIVKLSKLFLPKSMLESLDDWKYRKHLLVKICTKLKVPLDYIRDENQCNPLHLLLRNELFYSHSNLGLIIRELQNTCTSWIFQHDENGNLPLINILRDNAPNINVFKMVFDNAPTDSHRHRLVTILKSNRYTMGILIYFIVNETRKLVQFISCDEDKIIKNQLKKVFNIFGNNIRWIAKHHDPNKNRSVKQWLKGIDMDRYLDVFVSNELGIDTVFDKHYLNEIGISNKADIIDIMNSVDSLKSLLKNEKTSDHNKDLVDLSIVNVLSEDICFDHYMRYKIGTKLRDEFDLFITKEEEMTLLKWNKQAQQKSLFRMQTTMKLIENDRKENEKHHHIITEMRNWIGRIDKQLTKQRTKRRQKYVMGRSPTQIDENGNTLPALAEAEDEDSDSHVSDDEYAGKGTIISLGDTSRKKTVKNVKTRTFSGILWERLELVYAFAVEGLSVMDLFSDVIIFSQLWQSPEQWWTAWMLLFLLAPYLVSFCALASIFQSHQIAQITELNKFVIVVFLSPISILFLMILDIAFMFYVIVALILTLPMLVCCCNVSCIDSDWIFRLFGMSHMETKGYRRLRTLSQLIFETIPQIFLQMWILYALTVEKNETVQGIVDLNAIIFSVIVAGAHFLLEVTIISAEASATRVTLFQYGITCLNARLNWVPLSHLLQRHHRDYQQRQRQKALRKKKKNSNKKNANKKLELVENVLNFEELTHQVCKINYIVSFEFSSSAIRRLAGYVTRMQTYVDLSSNDAGQLGALLSVKHSDIPRIIIGKKCCANLTLSDLAVLYRNSAHRLVIEGGDELKWHELVDRHFENYAKAEEEQDKKQKKSEQNEQEKKELFLKKVKFLLNDFLVHGELDAVHEIFSEIDGGISTQELKQQLLSLQIDGGICKDIVTLRKFWKNKYMFGLSCDETHKIYKVILNYYEKALSLYQSMSVGKVNPNESVMHMDDELVTKRMNSSLTNQYRGILNMILLILWYSQGTILNHRCPECNISWRQYIDKNTKSQYRINLIKQLPENVKIFVKTVTEKRSGVFNQNKKVTSRSKNDCTIPFILCECSDLFAKKIDQKIMKDATTIGDHLFNFDDEDDSQTSIRKTDSVWSWLDIDEKDSTGTYHKYGDTVNKDINERLKTALSSTSANGNVSKLIAQKTVDTQDNNVDNGSDDEVVELKQMGSLHRYDTNISTDPTNDKDKIIYLNLTEGKFASEELSEEGEFFLKIDMKNVPWKYSEVQIKNGHQMKSKFVKRVTKENSINMIVLKDSHSITDKVLANLDQKNIDMLSTVIENKHDSTSSYAIMKNLYKQNLLTDLLLTAVKLKLRNGYDQLLVAISRFFRKQSITAQHDMDDAKKINFVFNYSDVEDHFINLTVLGIEHVSILLHIEDTNVSQIKLDKTDAKAKNVTLTLWMKIPNESKVMLDDWNNVLIDKLEVPSSALKKPMKFSCDLHEKYALGYFNPSLLGKNAPKNIEFYIQMSSDLSPYITTVQSTLSLIVNQTISETKFEKVNKRYTRENSIPKWQYVFDGQWTNYEHVTCAQIEEELKKILKQRKENDENDEKTIIIPITAGTYFSQSRNKNTYQIRIVCSVYPPRTYQLNVKTGHTRLVKQDPPYWVNIDKPLEDPYVVKWKYQCEADIDEEDIDIVDLLDFKAEDLEQQKYIYVDIANQEMKEDESKENSAVLSLQERIEQSYQQHLKRFKFTDEFGEKVIHFNYDSIPHTFIETENNDNDVQIQKVIRQKPLYLRKKGLDTDEIISMGPFWELIKPCSAQEYKGLSKHNTVKNRVEEDEFDIDLEIDESENMNQKMRASTKKQQCILCKCNMEEWELLDSQLSGYNIFKQKHKYEATISETNIEIKYDKYCEYIKNNTIVSIASDQYFHAACITQYFESQLQANDSERQILKCPKSDAIVYDSEKLDQYPLIGVKIKGKYEMIVNKDEQNKQIQILFVFGNYVSPTTHAIKYEENQLLQSYKDAFRRRLIQIDDDKNMIYIGKNPKLINVFRMANAGDSKYEIEEDILNTVMADVIMQKTVTYGGGSDNEQNENKNEDEIDIQAMIDSEMDNDMKEEEPKEETQETEHYNTKTVKFVDETVANETAMDKEEDEAIVNAETVADESTVDEAHEAVIAMNEEEVPVDETIKLIDTDEQL